MQIGKEKVNRMRRKAAIAFVLLTVGAGAPVVAQNPTVVGDEYFFSVGRPPGYIGPMPATFEDDGTTVYYVGLDYYSQLYITTNPADPDLDVEMMTIHTEAGQQREYAIVIDFTGVIDRVTARGYPPDIVGNTTFWFDDIESTTAGSDVPARRMGNLRLLRGAQIVDPPARFSDESGVTPPVPADDLFTVDAFGNGRIPSPNGFGEGLVFTLVDWNSVLTEPVIRIEFDLEAEEASVQTLTEQGMTMLVLVLVPAGAIYIHRRRRAAVVDEPDTWVL